MPSYVCLKSSQINLSLHEIVSGPYDEPPCGGLCYEPPTTTNTTIPPTTTVAPTTTTVAPTTTTVAPTTTTVAPTTTTVAPTTTTVAPTTTTVAPTTTTVAPTTTTVAPTTTTVAPTTTTVAPTTTTVAPTTTTPNITTTPQATTTPVATTTEPPIDPCAIAKMAQVGVTPDGKPICCAIGWSYDPQNGCCPSEGLCEPPYIISNFASVTLPQNELFGATQEITTKKIIEEMINSGVNMVLVGGYALKMYHINDNPRDLDFVYEASDENISKIIDILVNFGYEEENLQKMYKYKDSSFRLKVIVGNDMSIDFISNILNEIDYYSLINGTVKCNILDDINVNLISKNDLLNAFEVASKYRPHKYQKLITILKDLLK